jgi:hypothetical protein
MKAIRFGIFDHGILSGFRKKIRKTWKGFFCQCHWCSFMFLLCFIFRLEVINFSIKIIYTLKIYFLKVKIFLVVTFTIAYVNLCKMCTLSVFPLI